VNINDEQLLIKLLLKAIEDANNLKFNLNKEVLNVPGMSSKKLGNILNKKIIVLVLSSLRYPWNMIENEGIKKTWLTLKNHNIDVIFYYGGCNQNTILNNNIYSIIPEGLMNIGYRTLEAFEYLNKKYDYDILLRTNTSSYIDLILLNQYVNEKLNNIDDLFYAGQLGYYPPGKFNFLSGCGYFLSKKMVDFILSKKMEWDHSMIDDVSLGRLMSNYNINFNYTDRYTFNTVNDIVPTNYYHYRCKINENRFNDVDIMKKIHIAKGYI